MSGKLIVRSAKFSRPAEYGPWSQGVIVPAGRGLIFTTGLVARNPQGELAAPGDVQGQARQILENMKSLLAEVGSSLDDVVKMSVYLKSLDDVIRVQEVRNTYWPEDPPCSTTVEVSQLANGALLEIDAVALMPE